MSKVGLVGLGNMGSGMAQNLSVKGFTVVGFDIDETKTEASSVTDITNSCELVIVCLPNPDISRDVIFNQVLVDGSRVKTIIETSTLTPEIVLDFAKRLSAKNVSFLSAPMIGGKNHASDGKIEFLVEGSEELHNEVKDILDATGTTRYMGDIPSGTLAKLTFNLCRYANLATAVEAARLLDSYDANKEAIYEFMSEQSLDNFGQVWAEDMKPTMIEDIAFKPSGVPKKDLALLIEMAQSHNVDTSLIEALRQTYLSME